MDTSQYESNGQSQRRLYEWIVRIPFLFSALWSIGVALYVLLTPQIITQQIAVITPGGSETGEEIITRQVPWYRVQGLWGVTVLIIFALLFIAIVIFVLRKRLLAAAVTSFLAAVLTFLAGFSIGPLYLPALLAVGLGWALLGLGRLISSKEYTPG